MSLIWEMVGDQAEHQAQVRNGRVNRSLKDSQQYKIGTLVWLEQPPTTTFVSQDDHEKHKVKKAFRTRYTGLFLVLKLVSPITYILINGMKPLIGWSHIITEQSAARVVDNGTNERSATVLDTEVKEAIEDRVDVTVEMKRKRGRPRKKPLGTIVQSVREVVRGRGKKYS
jgi:hypothetical protein